MAVPAILLKAKKAAQNLKKAQAAKEAIQDDGQKKTLIGLFTGLPIVAAVLLPIIVITMIILVIVCLPQTLFTMFGAVGDHYTKYRGSYNGDLAYLQWAIDIANDDSHGYSQCNRNGSPDYDCSSLVWHSLVDGQGIDASELGGSAFSTCNEGEILKKYGFKEYPYTSHADLQPGDILITGSCVSHGHTEIYVGEDQMVGALPGSDGLCGAPGDQTGHEIDVRVNSSNWDYYYRLEG